MDRFEIAQSVFRKAVSLGMLNTKWGEKLDPFMDGIHEGNLGKFVLLAEEVGDSRTPAGLENVDPRPIRDMAFDLLSRELEEMEEMEGLTYRGWLTPVVFAQAAPKLIGKAIEYRLAEKAGWRPDLAARALREIRRECGLAAPEPAPTHEQEAGLAALDLLIMKISSILEAGGVCDRQVTHLRRLPAATLDTVYLLSKEIELIHGHVRYSVRDRPWSFTWPGWGAMNSLVRARWGARLDELEMLRGLYPVAISDDDWGDDEDDDDDDNSPWDGWDLETWTHCLLADAFALMIDGDPAALEAAIRLTRERP